MMTMTLLVVVTIPVVTTVRRRPCRQVQQVTVTTTPTSTMPQTSSQDVTVQ
jgi:hypothetical protein